MTISTTMAKKMEIKNVPIKDLKFAKYNPRQASEKEFNDLRESLKRFGFVEPIIVNSAPGRENVIIGGHFRVRVAKDMGIKEVPVHYVKISNIKKEKELNLRLNKNLGGWDFDLLANFDEGMLGDVGFNSEELDKIFGLASEDEDEVPEPPIKPKSKLGEIYQLGEHRLMCGDSTKKENVEKLIDGEKADMVFTDPPYGINLDTDFSGEKSRMGTDFGKRKLRGNKYDRIIGDDKEFDPSFIFKYFNCKEIFLWGADYYLEKLFKDGNLFVWDKRVDEQMDKIYGSAFELCWSKNKHKREIIRIRWAGLFGMEKEDTKKRIHPTQKPVALAEWFIKKFSKRGQSIIDLFGGSGSTLIACEKTNRVCYMLEIDPKYCDVIIKRWEEFTKKKVKKYESTLRSKTQ